MTLGTELQEAKGGSFSSKGPQPPSESSESPAAIAVDVGEAAAEADSKPCGAAVAEKVVGEGEGEGEGGGCVVIDVKCGGGGAAVEEEDGGREEDPQEERVCRICHVSPDRHRGGEGVEGLGMIQIGCACRGELGTAHRECAESWFKLKGNRLCEICGGNAKNINGDDKSTFMEEWQEGRISNNSSSRNSSERVGCWRGQPFCNFLMACLVIAFILPWFFRVSMF